jgi:Protein of unknown function (DUF3795)
MEMMGSWAREGNKSPFLWRIQSRNMADSIKQYHTIGCCGIDCGLCPRYHAKGDSTCPGCGGPDFKLKHPSCGFLSCCAVKHGLEVCAECQEFPCKRFDSERQGYDSFVTHQKVFANQAAIKCDGIDCFLTQQKPRINILEDFLKNYDDGRSKSFFCLACALLPLNNLNEIHTEFKNDNKPTDNKAANKQLKDSLQTAANELNIELKLRKKIN